MLSIKASARKDSLEKCLSRFLDHSLIEDRRYRIPVG
jgi:hypothetical protein